MLKVLSQFADDTKLQYTIVSDELSAVKLQTCYKQKLQTCPEWDCIYNWSTHWQLKLSPTICTAMHLNSTRKNKDNLLSAEYSICGSVLPVVSSVTDLCVSYDIRFSFRPRIINVLHKASLRAKLILKCFVTCDPSVLCKAFSVFLVQLWSFLL